jgi:hypothetical protein
VSRVKLYTRSNPIFDEFGVTAELEKALRPKVWLKSGGYIVINQTEALVAIDINTGKYVGKSNRLEDTIVKTNTGRDQGDRAPDPPAGPGRHHRGRFIDMDERKNRQKVMQALEESMRPIARPYKILQFNDFGLVAITRKRVKQSLERTLCTPCPYCEGAGYVKSPQTVVSEILVEAQKIARAVDNEGRDCCEWRQRWRNCSRAIRILTCRDRGDSLQTGDRQERSAVAPGEIRPGINTLSAYERSCRSVAAAGGCGECRRALELSDKRHGVKESLSSPADTGIRVGKVVNEVLAANPIDKSTSF